MSRFRNADSSLLEFRRVCRDYDHLFKPRIEQIRATYLGEPSRANPPQIDESLEAHIRAFVVNALLNALNWRLNRPPEEGLPNLIPEAPISSEERKTTRFLDYLGFERETNRPLLIIETKRPRSPLPRRRDDSPTSGYDRDYSHIICSGIEGSILIGKWNGWLKTLCDYVRSAQVRTGQVPQRVVITNGDWLILFTDPADAFLGSAPNPAGVLVWQDRDDINRRYAELFRWLEYCSVSADMPPLAVEELPFHVAPESVDCIMHGLRILYFEEPGFHHYESAPMIKVLPVLFLHLQHGIWARVEEPGESRIKKLPHSYQDLPEHLEIVAKLAKELLEKVNEVLGVRLDSSPLATHYADSEFLDERVGVEEVGYRPGARATEYLVVTGSNTHYLLPQPSVPGCPYHDWLEAQHKGVESNPGPVLRRSVYSPRSFFQSSEDHYCAHREVANAKASPITTENLNLCSPRSGKVGDAFCEIAGFEEHLCCRTCAFEDVCTKSPIFHLPCKHTEG